MRIFYRRPFGALATYRPNSTEKLNALLVRVLFIAICFVGIFLRVYLYAINRSLALDEAMLALNIVEASSYSDLFGPLRYNQGAPLGFLLLEKFAISWLGNKDYVLRLVPLLAGIAAVILMYLVARHYTTVQSSIIVLTLFSLSEALIHYSSELKQYSSDAMIALILLLATSNLLKNSAKPQSLIALAVAGSAALWMSHPAVFLLAAIGITLAIAFFQNKTLSELPSLVTVGLFWAANLSALYVLSLRYLAANTDLTDYWREAFMPLPPWSDYAWFYHALGGLLTYPSGLPADTLTVVLLLFGAFSFLRKQWQFASILILPFVLVLTASASAAYPFSGRFLLFLVPLMLLLVAEGVEWIRSVLVRRFGASTAFFATVVLTAYLLYLPIVTAYENYLHPKLGEHIKPVMLYLSINRTHTDDVYVNHGAVPAFQYYAPFYEFREGEYRYLKDIKHIGENRRSWFVFSHNKVDEEPLLLEHLDRIGSRKDKFLSIGSSAYLYELGQ